jgi:hypothetical protein
MIAACDAMAVCVLTMAGHYFRISHVTSLNPTWLVKIPKSVQNARTFGPILRLITQNES